MESTQTRPKGAKDRMDIYEMITQRIVEKLEEGVVPWQKTWKNAPYAQNFVSGRNYQGINRIITNLSPHEAPFFLTMRQANHLGGKIKKGEKSLPIVFWQAVHKDPDGNVVPETQVDNHPNLTKHFLTRYYRVWNIEQTEGIDWLMPTRENPGEPIDEAEGIVEGMPNPPEIRREGHEAFYSPPTDIVQVPAMSSFEEPTNFYSVLFHELGHATGAHNRLAREAVTGTVKFGSCDYSLEELVAELTSCTLCSIAGIETTRTFTNSASYIQGWLSKLQDDKRFIFKAASQSKKAVEYILG